jgi:L-aminopeptidase/D-esterase-like protein
VTADNPKQEKPTTTLEFSWDSVKIGTAEYPAGPTGTTVLVFPNGAYGAVDIRGGAAAVREESSLSSHNSWGSIDALVFAGGSTYGLAAADGVMAGILEDRKNSVAFDKIPAVPAAIIYDFTGRKNAIYPDRNLGYQAYKNAVSGKLAWGKVGAGVNASVGKYFSSKLAQGSGQAASFVQFGEIKILVLSVVNAVGNIYNEKGQIIAGSYDTTTNSFVDVFKEVKSRVEKAKPAEIVKGNTTISVVVTNVKLSRSDLERLGMMVHTSMAESIRPFQTPWDGDVLFALSTADTAMPENVGVSDVAVLASAEMNQAIRRLFTEKK